MAVEFKHVIPTFRIYSLDKARPGLDKHDWGMEMTVIDPFANRIRFNEPHHKS